MARTTITLPDELIKRLEPIRDRINVSEICRSALESRISAYEKTLNELADEEPNFAKMVARIKSEVKDSSASAYERGRTRGLKWALEKANYIDFITWVENDQARIHMASDGGVLPPTVDEYYVYFNTYPVSDVVSRAHDRGFYDAAEEVWAAAKPKILDES